MNRYVKVILILASFCAGNLVGRPTYYCTAFLGFTKYFSTYQECRTYEATSGYRCQVK